ncbi:MAG: glycosyltransferase family 39 protein [Phaeodactylibacter sp.]|nr:glycosyltransferase family 39 protein [Phaeodactylibacter sp.]MCB9272571.1 glycosyltransferase family 39 protein [Lewinellaceae bacterium]
MLALIAAKLAIHLYANALWGFHRDEFLYLSLGCHLDWGYWSNPPLIGWVSALWQGAIGDSPFAFRLFPMLVSCALMVLVVLMARELGAGRYGQFLAGVAMLLTPANLRPGMLFQPVVPDIFFWALLAYLVIRYINTGHKRDILFFGLAFGLSFLNKYATGFALLGFACALLLSPYRRVLWSREAGLAALIALALILPNLLWQSRHGFPVVAHMQGLAENQLVNVRIWDFLTSQLFMNMSVIPVWVAGLAWFFHPTNRRYRVMGWYFVLVFMLLLLLRGKPYYTLGLYPMLIAAGGVWWENALQRAWLRVALPLLILLILLPALPLGLPVLPLPQMRKYCAYLTDKVGFDGPMRWEDGQIHPLPQDYADMLGWEELGQLAIRACREAEGESLLLYCENYGEAGAVDYYGRGQGIPAAISFSDSYRLWLPHSTSAQTLVYINDELGEDVNRLFADIRLIGAIRNPNARERGTSVYLCRQPRQSLGKFWASRVKAVLEGE